jgi:hypothetical protein
MEKPMRQSYTAVIERNETWKGDFATEPYEVAWAGEAIFFVRALQVTGQQAVSPASVQISPDGIHWCNEGTLISLPREPGLTYCRVSHFGGWLRVAGRLPEGLEMKVIVYLSLKE